jgi:hypothetical protein
MGRGGCRSPRRPTSSLQPTGMLPWAEPLSLKSLNPPGLSPAQQAPQTCSLHQSGSGELSGEQASAETLGLLGGGVSLVTV